ncbi:MAG: Fe-S cluster assembly protein SufD [Cyanobacteria bacterium P01_C01_bin.120]
MSTSNPGAAPKLSRQEQRNAYLRSLLKSAQSQSFKALPLMQLRSQAAAILAEHTLPSTQDEEWRFTDLKPMLSVPFEAAAGLSKVSPNLLAAVSMPEATARLVFVNGYYNAELSAIDQLPAGVIVGNLAALTDRELEEQLSNRLARSSSCHDIFSSLNTAGFQDAAVIWVPRGQVLEQPIQIVTLSVADDEPLMASPRCLVIAEANSALTFVEDFYGTHERDYFTNSVTEIWVDDGAAVTHVRLQREGAGTFHIGRTAITQGRDSRYTTVPVTLGAQISRHNLEVYQTGPQTDTNLYSLTAIAQSQLADTHSLIATNHPHGTADQLHKTIVDDTARAVFNGKVWVPKNAQLTNASQLNRNLLLSRRARVDTKPELDIVADNVKCAHGATVSQLDTSEVFYLQSRGISAAAAQRLLIYGFAMDIIDRIPIPSLKQSLTANVTQRSLS